MEKTLASEYAHLLNRGDVVRLFSRLEKETNRSKAARICGLGRRTTYDWDGIGEPLYRTKYKVLEALLARKYEQTLVYLLERSNKNSKNIIHYLLKNIYELAMEETIQRSVFEETVQKFDQIVVKYSEIIKGAAAEEMEEMRMNLCQRAIDFQIEMEPLPLSTMSSEDVMSTITMLAPRVDMLSHTSLNRLSKDFWLPKEILSTALEIKIQLTPKTEISESITSIENEIQDRLPIRPPGVPTLPIHDDTGVINWNRGGYGVVKIGEAQSGTPQITYYAQP